jgi:hypothetical protein
MMNIRKRILLASGLAETSNNSSDRMRSDMKSRLASIAISPATLALLLISINIPLFAQIHEKPAPPAGVEEVCSISFVKDSLRPARVENGALPCLKQATQRLNANPNRKLVLVGVKDPAKDHEGVENGSEREEEDSTGFDVRLEDLSGYRAVNAKWYLVHYLQGEATRIIPTTDESYFAQSVTFYLVPASADFNHNFLGTTKTNEKPCTITPCYPADEETLAPQRRPRIVEGSLGQTSAEVNAEKREFAAFQRRSTPVNMNGTQGNAALAPLPPRPTPEHPATTSIIP